jgi:hypothetical protein
MFNIGQKIICVKTHSQNIVVRGQEYVVVDIDTCRCGNILIDVGLSSDREKMGCVDCAAIWKDNAWWLSARLFAPIEEKSETNFNEIMVGIGAVAESEKSKCPQNG